jgi:hypothetical protein
MSSFPDLKIPETWKPLFRAIDDQGWEFKGPIACNLNWDYRYILRFGQGSIECHLTIFEEPEWCGNHLQARALTVAGLSWELPTDRNIAESVSLVLTGNWTEEVSAFVGLFLEAPPSKTDPISLNHNGV